MLDFDIEKMCRVCLKTNLDLFLLFDEENATDGVFVSEMISDITIYKVRRYDDFPHQICLECMQRVRSAYELKKQFERSHRKLLSYLNSINKITTDTRPDKPNDKDTQTEDSTFYPCEKCEKSFLNYENLRIHREDAHKGTAHICRFCSRRFIRIGDLKSHIGRHHPDVRHFHPHVCLVCDRKFTRKNHVTRHMEKVHKIKDDNETNKTVSNDTDNNLNETKTIQNGQDNEGTLLDQEYDYDDDEEDACSIGAGPNPLSSDDDDKPLADLRNSLNVKNEESKDFSIKEELDEIPIAIESNHLQPQPNVSEITDILNTIKTEDGISDKPSSPNEKQLSAEIKNIRKFKCTICEKSFARSHHLKRHILSHEKPFKCKFCDSRFGRTDHLKIHMSKHVDNQSFECEICHKAFNKADCLKQHKQRKHNINGTAFKSENCTICNKQFSSKSYLQKHMKLHSNKFWKCKFCEIGFETKEALKEHNKSHTQEKPFLCSQCGMSFVRNDYLLIHMRRHTGEKPYKCKYCDKGFPRATDLNVHVKYHTGERTHLCTICGKGFQRSYNLVVHMRVHTGERPYKCPHCPKDFAQGNDLKAHIRRHTGERFKCKTCGEGFIQAYHLTQHNIDVHGLTDSVRKGRLAKVKLPNPSPKEESIKPVLMQEDNPVISGEKGP